MADRDDRPRGILELARPATPVPRRRVAALAAVARPAGEVAAFLLVEVLGRPRARAAALALARSLAHRVAGGRLLPSAMVGVSAAAWRVTVVEESTVGARSGGALVRCVETALVLPSREEAPPARRWGPLQHKRRRIRTAPSMPPRFARESPTGSVPAGFDWCCARPRASGAGSTRRLSRVDRTRSTDEFRGACGSQGSGTLVNGENGRWASTCSWAR